ncbi:MAG: hypothetical protein ACOYVK_09475 [Bacillota bacterium]
MSRKASELINAVYEFIYSKFNKGEDLSDSDISVLNQYFDSILLELKTSN